MNENGDGKDNVGLGEQELIEVPLYYLLDFFIKFFRIFLVFSQFHL